MDSRTDWRAANRIRCLFSPHTRVLPGFRHPGMEPTNPETECALHIGAQAQAIEVVVSLSRFMSHIYDIHCVRVKASSILHADIDHGKKQKDVHVPESRWILMRPLGIGSFSPD
jgi:hypothetical protein